MQNNRYSVITGSQITDEHFDGFLRVDRSVFPRMPSTIGFKGWEQACERKGAVPFCDVSAEYWQETYKDNKDGMFLLIENEMNKVVGSLNAQFVSDRQRDQYLDGSIDFEDVKSIKPSDKQLNSLLISNMALLTAHRNKSGIKQLGSGLAKWLVELQKQGKELGFVFAEAGSAYGANSLTKGFGMIPLEEKELASDGGGLYYSPDSLQRYIKKMQSLAVTEQENNTLIDKH